MPLAEALLAEQGRISAGPAPSRTRSQQISHTDPKGCLCSQLSGRSSPGEQREAQVLLQSHEWLSEGAAPGPPEHLVCLILFPQAQSARIETVALVAARALDQGTKVSRVLRLEPSLTRKQQHGDPSLPGPPPPHCSLGPVSMRGDLSCLLWDPQ